MAIVMGLDRHRERITFELIDTDTGEVGRGRVRPADRPTFRAFLRRFAGRRVEAALEATTGCRFICEELEAAGAEVHLAEPAETSALGGPKRRAKSDRQDARHLRQLLLAGRLPESWIPPEQILAWRSLVGLRKALVDERTAWQQRIRAQLFHHGQPRRRDLLTRANRAWLERLELPEAALTQVETALGPIDALNARLEPLDGRLRSLARRQPGCLALTRHYGIGEPTALAILAELGDARRFSSSRDAVRYAGLDTTVHESDRRRAAGHLSRQGPPLLRWALFEAAQVARRSGSPDHDYYAESNHRLGSNRARLAIARKPLERSYHTLRELGDEALQPLEPIEQAAPQAA
jgi:transposase